MPSPVRLGPGTLGFPGDVTSVFGRVGAVIAVNGDYTFAQLSGKPTTLAGYGITDSLATTDPRLSDDRTANAIRTATAKSIATAADPIEGAIFVFQGGAWRPVTPATFQGTSSSYTGTANTGVGVMMGVGGLITPAFSGRVIVTVCGRVKNTTAACGANLSLRRGSLPKPANQAAAAGITIGPPTEFSGAGWGVNQVVPFSITALDQLTVGTQFWFDVLLAAVAGGTAQILFTAITAHEF